SAPTRCTASACASPAGASAFSSPSRKRCIRRKPCTTRCATRSTGTSPGRRRSRAEGIRLEVEAARLGGDAGDGGERRPQLHQAVSGAAASRYEVTGLGVVPAQRHLVHRVVNADPEGLAVCLLAGPACEDRQFPRVLTSEER